MPEKHAGSFRAPHAAVDVEGRKLKARTILAVLDPELPPGLLDLLEVGTGSGVMAQHFAEVTPTRFKVRSVDVVDLRIESAGYEFTLVEGVELPFPDASFDVVVSNHVVEHVGDRDSQCRHLKEVARVLRSDGIAYLATPSRWALVEPHFKLPLLSWLPPRLSDVYVRKLRRGDHYDCRPLGPIALSRLFAEADLLARHSEVGAVSHGAHAETWVGRVARSLGAGIRHLWGLSPTFVVLLKRATRG